MPFMANLLARSKNRIAVVKIDGIISDSGSFGAGRARIVAALKEAERKNAQGVVVRVNSPGGTVAACQEVFSAISRLKEKGMPVVASLGDVAASGGIYIAMAAGEIIASPGSITGSIGVIIRSNDLSSLYGKVGVSPKVVKSGAHKDMLATYRPLSPEELDLLQDVINDSYDQFVDVIATARGKPRSDVERVADGRIMTGRQAQQAGLVDGLGDLETAVDRAASLAQLKGKPRVVLIQPRRSLSQRLLGPFTRYTQSAVAGYSLSGIPLWVLPTL